VTPEPIRIAVISSLERPVSFCIARVRILSQVSTREQGFGVERPRCSLSTQAPCGSALQSRNFHDTMVT
jgi:hypothetical protein